MKTAHTWHLAPPSDVAALIEHAARGAPEISAQLGDVTLLPHQRAAVALLRRTLEEYRGALLADEVGLGKTYTALGAAREYERVLIVAPAVLRATWIDAARRCATRADVTSYQRLSAGHAHATERWDLVILDEAHHARNPATRRYAALAQLTWGAHVLLVSATPIHNRRRDLDALFALFLGTAASTIDDVALAALIVRRTTAHLLRGEAETSLAAVASRHASASPAPRAEPSAPDAPPVWNDSAVAPQCEDNAVTLGHANLPMNCAMHGRDAANRHGLMGRARRTPSDSVDEPAAVRLPPPVLALPELLPLEWHQVPPAPQLFAEIVGIPPPVPPADGGVARALVTLALLRAWCSSDSALLDAIQRRLAIAAALEHALLNGRFPTRRELAAWTVDDDALQLPFPELMASPLGGDRVAPLLDAIQVHGDALRQLRTRVRGTCARDAYRFGTLHRVIARAPDRRVVIFTHARATARAAYEFLQSPERGECRPRIALLSGPDGRIASGPIARHELIAAFASGPDAGASRANVPNDAMRLDALVTTDVLSEGIDLHGAGAVVHLDLPWTVARVEQRVGRLRRLGSHVRAIAQHLIAPPVDAEELESVVTHLIAKGRLVRHVVGAAPGIPTLSLPPRQPLAVASQVAPSPSHTRASPPDVAEQVRQAAATLAKRCLVGASASQGANEWQGESRTSSGGCLVAVLRARPDAFAADAAILPAMAADTAALTAGAAAAVIRRDGRFDLIAVRSLAPLDCSARHVARRPVVTTDPSLLLEVLDLLAAAVDRAPRTAGFEAPNATDAKDGDVDALIETLADWCRSHDAARDALAGVHTRSAAHRVLLRAIATLSAHAPRGARPRIAAAGAAARDVVQRSTGVGAETALGSLVSSAPRAGGSEATALAWLASIASALAPRANALLQSRESTRLVALMMLALPATPALVAHGVCVANYCADSHAPAAAPGTALDATSAAVAFSLGCEPMQHPHGAPSHGPPECGT